MLVVKRLYRYSYAETERYVSDSLVLRQFYRVYLNLVPDDTTIPLAEKVVDQTRRRILEGEKVPAQEKVVSIFEPHIMPSR